MSDVDRLSESKAERVRRVRIATELLPALGLGPWSRSAADANVASERAIRGSAGGAPEQEPAITRQEAEADGVLEHRHPADSLATPPARRTHPDSETRSPSGAPQA